MKKILIYILMVLGEIFILSTSFIFLKELEPTSLFALNTTVISLVYLLIYSLCFDLFNFASLKSGSSTAHLGALIWGTSTYIILALCLIISSYAFAWERSIAIWAQCGALLPLLLSIVVSVMSGSTVSQAEQMHEKRKLSLQLISENLIALEANVKCDPTKSQRIAAVENIKEQLRYITHSENPNAKVIESRLLQTIIGMTRISSSTAQDNTEWNLAAERCFTLIALRKQQL